MSVFKKLAGQTAIYGLPTIVGRLLSYFLVPLFTYSFKNPSVFGIHPLYYSYISFLNIIFTYGMETALFNFSINEPDKKKVYSTAFISVLMSTIVLCIPVLFFSGAIGSAISQEHPFASYFVVWSILIVATDAIAAVPYAKLREEKRPGRFALIRSVNIVVNIALSVFFIGFCQSYYTEYSWIASFYNPSIGIGYAFIANLIANAVTVLMFLPHLSRISFVFDKALWKRMIAYALPLLLVGLAGIANENLDRILLKWLLPKETAMKEIGIYSACYKIAVIMTVFTQAFRYAAEPFFFSHSKQQDARKTYADVMKYFVIICLIIFLGTTLNIDWIKYFVHKNFWEGVKVVPILLLANLCLGVVFNLSIWYKLTNKTSMGAYVTVVGALITVVLNLLWIPSVGYFGGYMGCAWATFICYFIMVLVSYRIGQKHYPIDYPIRVIGAYTLVALAIFAFSAWMHPSLIINNLLLLLFIGGAFWMEKKSWQKNNS